MRKPGLNARKTCLAIHITVAIVASYDYDHLQPLQPL